MTETGHGSDVASIAHDRHLRPRRPRSSSSTRPPGPPARTTSATRPWTAGRPSVFAQLDHQRREPRRARLLRADPRRGRRRPARRRRRGRRPQGRPQRRRQRPAALRPRPGPARQPAQPLRRRRRGRHLHLAHREPAAASSPCSARSCTAGSARRRGRGRAQARPAHRRPLRRPSGASSPPPGRRRGRAARLPGAPAQAAARAGHDLRAALRARRAAAEVRRRLPGAHDTDEDRAGARVPRRRRSRRSAPGTPRTRSRCAARPAAAPATWRRTGSPRLRPTPTCSPPSRATTPSCCSSSPRACSPTTPRSSANADAACCPLRRRAGRQVRATARGCAVGQSVADFGSDRAPSSCAQGRASQHELLTGRVQQMVAEIAGALRPPRPLRSRGRAPLFNTTRTSSSRPPGPTASCCSGRPSPTRSPRSRTGTRQVLTWLRDLFGLSPHREEPRLVPDQRAAFGAAGRIRLALHRSPAAGSARTRRTSSTPSASARSTCARRSPRWGAGAAGRGPGLRRARASAARPRWMRRC